MTAALTTIAALAGYTYACGWLARRKDRKGILGFLNRVRANLAYEGDSAA